VKIELVPLFLRKIAIPAKSFEDAVSHAIRQLEDLGGRAEVVTGPITTGGFGNPTLNVVYFNEAIRLLTELQRPMFSQMPFEACLAELEEEWFRKHTLRPGEIHPILQQFYEPIFRRRLIRRAWFLPSWKTSQGATWEHQMLLEFDCDIRYLPENWICAFELPLDLD